MFKSSLVFVWFLVVLSRNGFLVDSRGVPPRIIHSSQRLYRKNLGQNVKLHCRATGAQDDTNNRTLFFWKNQFGLIRQNRLRWPRYDIRQNQFLKIRNIQPEDAGVYICTATNEFGSDFAKRILKVFKDGKELAPKKPKHRKKPTRKPLPAHAVKFMEGKSSAIRVVLGKRSNPVKIRIVGGSVKLKCIMKKSTPSHISWRKDGIPIEEDSRTRFTDHFRILHLKHLSERDSGNYTCIVSSQSVLTNQTFRLVVKNLFTYRQPNLLPLEKIKTSIGSNFTLTCETQAQRNRGMPPVRFQRYPASESESLFRAPVQRDRNKSASKRQKHTRTHWRFTTNRNGKVLVSLTFYNITRKDAGRYICITGKRESARNVKAIVVDIIDTSNPVDKIPEDDQLDGKRKKTASSGNDVGIPLFLLIIAPLIAGIVCMVFVLICWRRHREKEKIARGLQPNLIKKSETETSVTNGHICTNIQNGSLNTLSNGFNGNANRSPLTIVHHEPSAETRLKVLRHSDSDT